MTGDRNRVCPARFASLLDNRLRRCLQNPRKILSPFVREGMKVLDVGCGPGFFSLELARMVGIAGSVISADLQQGMLQKLGARVRGTELEDRIYLVKCESDNINVTEKIDFALAFWMVHEVPDKASFFKQLKHVLKNNGQILIVEPKLFHVSRKEFQSTVAIAEQAGLALVALPRLLFSWSAVLKNAA